MSQKTWQKLKNNPDLFNRYFVKEYTLSAIRKFFEARNYHELESPILAGALPQERYLNVLQTEIELASGKSHTAYLIPSTETYNKKILAAGLGNHFVITKVFRALEEISPNHVPEFTMLEWYTLGGTYFDLMSETEELVVAIKKFIDSKFNREFSPTINYQGQEINLAAPWDRISVSEGLKKYAGLDYSEIENLDLIRKVLTKRNYNIKKEDDWQTMFEMLFGEEVETQFAKDKPTFVYDYPRILCPLTKVKESDPRFCEKVELYIAGRELANGYTELRDPDEQERRFLEEQSQRAKMGLTPINFDHDLVEAIRSGIPEVAGIGMGIDRLAMILADAKSVSEINYFPAGEMFE